MKNNALDIDQSKSLHHEHQKPNHEATVNHGMILMEPKASIKRIIRIINMIFFFTYI
jgi:hypothetical protein